MGVAVGQPTCEDFFFFLAAKENKFYSPGTTQHFLPQSIKTSQKPAGLLAGKGAGFLVELLAPCSRLACDVLQTHAWAGEERTGKGRGRDSVVHTEMLNIGGWHVVVHTGWWNFHQSGPAFPHRCPSDSDWGALAGRGEHRAPLSAPKVSDFSLISEPVDSETTHLFTDHSCPWKHTQISGAAAGAHTLATQGRRSSSARGLHAALSTPPSHIRQCHEAGNIGLGRRRAVRGKAKWRKALRKLAGADGEDLPQLSARWRELCGSKRRHANVCTAHAVGCKDVAGFQKGVCFVAVDTVPWFMAGFCFFLGLLFETHVQTGQSFAFRTVQGWSEHKMLSHEFCRPDSLPESCSHLILFPLPTLCRQPSFQCPLPPTHTH